MMSQSHSKQGKLLVATIEDLLADDHFLRKLDNAVDFSFIYDIVRTLYSQTGRPSIDPVVLVKMLLIGYLYGIDSERKLEQEVRYNIAYRWFLGLDLEDAVPDHSTISQNRRRRFHGNEIFRQIFEAIVEKCAEAGLVRGESVVMDSTHVKANADNQNSEWVQVTQSIDQYWLNLMDRYPEKGERDIDNECRTIVKSKNPNDPEAGYMNRSGKPKGFHYLAHQSSDADTGIILDVEVTSGDIQDCECCVERFAHLKQRRIPVKRAAMDKGYDTIPIHSGLSRLGIEAYISRCDRGNGPHADDELFSIEDFRYDTELDCYICPNHCYLTYRGRYYRKGIPLGTYCARTSDCKSCAIRQKCYKGKERYRRINRCVDQAYREAGIARIGNRQYLELMRKRRIVCEGNFALQKRCHNLRFTRKRGKENVLEQSLLSATALNLKRLVWYGAPKLRPAVTAENGWKTNGVAPVFLLSATVFAFIQKGYRFFHFEKPICQQTHVATSDSCRSGKYQGSVNVPDLDLEADTPEPPGTIAGRSHSIVRILGVRDTPCRLGRCIADT